jgi:hypothetical protein
MCHYPEADSTAISGSPNLVGHSSLVDSHFANPIGMGRHSPQQVNKKGLLYLGKIGYILNLNILQYCK